jgi:hypothetical protein
VVYVGSAVGTAVKSRSYGATWVYFKRNDVMVAHLSLVRQLGCAER